MAEGDCQDFLGMIGLGHYITQRTLELNMI